MADRLERALTAYRAREPRRSRDPFAAPDLRAALGGEPLRRAGSRWASLSPAPLFAGAALALLLAVAPLETAPLMPLESTSPRVIAAPAEDTGGREDVILLAVAALLALAGVVRHRHTGA
jgi:hypothetical protein